MYKKKLVELDIAIGICIILVVLGHAQIGEEIRWFDYFRDKVIYNFHMPLFFYFSGFLISYNYKPILNRNDYSKYLKKKLKKFIPPYLIFSFIFIFYDFVASGFSSIQLNKDIISMLFYPSKSAAGFLWYVFVLLEFYIIFPIIFKLVKKYYFKIFFLSLALSFLPMTNFLSLNLFTRYLLFIIGGIICSDNIDEYYKYIKSKGLIFVILFISMIILNVYRPLYNSKVILGLFSVPAIHFVSIKLLEFKFKKYLISLGKNSFYIYLMNTLVIGILHILFIQVLNFDISILFILISFILGLILPILIYHKIIKKISFLSLIIN